MWFIENDQEKEGIFSISFLFQTVLRELTRKSYQNLIKNKNVLAFYPSQIYDREISYSRCDILIFKDFEIIYQSNSIKQYFQRIENS